jgi:excisionase family DNA binding protein
LSNIELGDVHMDSTTTPTAAGADFLTTDELADYLKVPAATIRAWRHNDKGPKGVRLGRHVRYRRVDVDAWVAAETRAQRPRAV